MPAIRKAIGKIIDTQTKDLGHGVVEVVVATEDLDRHGERLAIKGLNIKDYSGVVLWGHDYFSFPIGKSLGLRKTMDGKLVSKTQFAIDEYDFANTAYKLVKNGYAPDVSIGFIPEEWDASNNTWTKSSMVEYSHVSIGANPEARVKALKAVGLTKDEFEQQVREHMLQMKSIEEDDEEPSTDTTIDEDDTVTKGAISPHKTGVDMNGSWDGPANEARLKNDAGSDVFKRFYAWVDPAKDPNTKAAYKFGHHNVDSGGSVGDANYRGCTAGIAVLNGGRGGTNIPDSDRQGVYNHLAKHISDGGATPPELKSLEEIEDKKLDKSTKETVMYHLDAAKSLLSATEQELDALNQDSESDDKKTKIIKKRIILVRSKKTLNSVDHIVELAIGELKKQLKRS